MHCKTYVTTGRFFSRFVVYVVASNGREAKKNHSRLLICNVKYVDASIAARNCKKRKKEEGREEYLLEKHGDFS